MAGLCEGDNDLAGSLKAICQNTQSYFENFNSKSVSGSVGNEVRDKLELRFLLRREHRRISNFAILDKFEPNIAPVMYAASTSCIGLAVYIV
ncbi:hypothetical protein ANN_23849 [Periplaneta americana]|uniref:Uncharacterized protein n=1 Tax=Periplaneta americana TaxID=6978 RepID=A0ABQ8SNB6_PERAM|nr:hypothetical protein ANN_23849 [Periplaneta americana]